jgi:hypothetical protein
MVSHIDTASAEFGLRLVDSNGVVLLPKIEQASYSADRFQCPKWCRVGISIQAAVESTRGWLFKN